MLYLTLGAERYALKPGVNTLGGQRADSLPIDELANLPASATITVTAEGPAVIQRLTAKVVVRVNDQPLGSIALELRDRAQIDVGHCRLVLEDARSRRPTPRAGMAAAASPGFSAPTEVAMPILAATSGARLVEVRTGRSYGLAGRRVEIGRDATCSIVLTGAGVSRHHATVTHEAAGYVVTDQSANGTLVNGVLVSGSRPLAHGDVIRIQEQELRFEDEEGQGALAAAATVALRPRIAPATQAPTPAPRRAPPVAVLEIARGRLAGTSYRVERPVCAIGRGEQSDVRIPDESVSASHATLLRKGETWYVIDLRSVNGTFVDGYRIAGERALPAGARLRLGSVEMIFRPVTASTGGGNVTRHVKGVIQRLLRLLERPA